jgi:7-keto-8-aminopelargonate synthetase-like enzyme
LVLFSSNNYLGLTGHPLVKRAARDALRTYGAGAGAARGTTGTLRVHRDTESAIARFEGREDAVIFPSGYMAMVGAIEGLTEANSVVVCDEHDHPSVSAGCDSAGVELRRYAHCDPDSLRVTLRRIPRRRDVLVVTSSVFAVSGSVAPLDEIASATAHTGARLLVDEAHGTGVLGVNGRGGAEVHAVEDQVWVTLGTLSKALGSTGGFLAGPRPVMDAVRERARAYKYTTAPAPSACAAAMVSLQLIGIESPVRRRLRRNLSLMSGLLQDLAPALPERTVPIFPLRCASPNEARRLATALLEEGYLVAALAPPLLPEGVGLVRLTVASPHAKTDIEGLIRALGRTCRIEQDGVATRAGC